MTQQANTETPQTHAVTPPAHREWFWRVLAGLMLLTIGWMGWVAYQLTPHSVATPAAYAAISEARSARNVQEGMIKQAPVAKKAPPVDVEKLRLSDTIETPIQQK